MATQREKLIAMTILKELTEQQIAWVQNVRETDADCYAELVATYQESTDTTDEPTSEQLAIAEVDSTVAAGDALRNYLERYEDIVCEVWEDRERALAWVLAGNDG